MTDPGTAKISHGTGRNDHRRTRGQDILNRDHPNLIAEGELAPVPDLAAENVEGNETQSLSMVTTHAIEAEAERRGVKPSVVMRRWIEDGLRSSADRSANLSVPLLAIACATRGSHVNVLVSPSEEHRDHPPAIVRRAG